MLAVKGDPVAENCNDEKVKEKEENQKEDQSEDRNEDHNFTTDRNSISTVPDPISLSTVGNLNSVSTVPDRVSLSTVDNISCVSTVEKRDEISLITDHKEINISSLREDHTSSCASSVCDHHSKKVTDNSFRSSDSGLSSAETSTPRYHEARSKERVALSHSELQNAKKRLEELRSLRFEEKTSLQEDIFFLNERVGKEEINTTILEKQLKNVEEINTLKDSQLRDLENEKRIASESTMLQEQELARVSLQCKREEFERVSVAQQLDITRKTMIEKDQLRMRQQEELHVLTQRLAQLEEQNISLKVKNERKEQTNHELELRVNALKRDLLEKTREQEESRACVEESRVEVVRLKQHFSTVEEQLSQAQCELSDLKGLNESLKVRCETQEKEFESRESNLQREIEHTSFNESKSSEKCEELERNYHEVRRKNDELRYELKGTSERQRNLQTEYNAGEQRKAQLDFLLNEIQIVVRRHISANSDIEVTGEITADILNEYFIEVATKMRSYQSDSTYLSEQIHRGEDVIDELNKNVTELKSELSEAHQNFLTGKKKKEELEEQFRRANDTIKIQERDLSRKLDEVSQLQKAIQDHETHFAQLKDELQTSKERSSSKYFALQDENRQLQAQVKELELKCLSLEKSNGKLEKRTSKEGKHYQSKLDGKSEECRSLKLKLENEESANKEKEKVEKKLREQLEKLIDDNKHLAQRLIHLESYSDRVAEMLESNQTENEKLKERLEEEKTQNRIERETEILNLTSKRNELNGSLKISEDTNAKLHRKLKDYKEELRVLAATNKTLKATVDQLERQIKSLNEAHVNAEKRAIEVTELNKSLSSRFDEQTSNVESLFAKINQLEAEKVALRENASHFEKRYRQREQLLEELTTKNEKTLDSYHSLRMSLKKADSETKVYEDTIRKIKMEKSGLEKSIRDRDVGNEHFKQQLTNLQHLLAKAEDEKESSLGRLARLENEHNEEDIRRQKHTNDSIKQLQTQVKVLSESLNTEKEHREKLEQLNYRRDDQLTQLRSTFDQSLTTITKDTHNIKTILGKSLKKIDKQINNNDISDSDIPTDVEEQPTANTKYLNLPSSKIAQRSRSLGLDYSKDKSYNFYTSEDLHTPVKSRSKPTMATPTYKKPTSRFTR